MHYSEEEKVKNWLKAQDMGYLLEALDMEALNPKLSDWEAVVLAEKLADILLELNYEKYYNDFSKAEASERSFLYDHSAQYENRL